MGEPAVPKVIGVVAVVTLAEEPAATGAVAAAVATPAVVETGAAVVAATGAAVAAVAAETKAEAGKSLPVLPPDETLLATAAC